MIAIYFRPEGYSSMIRLHSSTQLRIQGLLVATLILMASLGCRPRTPVRSPQEREVLRTRLQLEHMIKEKRDVEGRATAALAKLDNGILDDVPFPLYVRLQWTESGEPELSVVCFDEGRDLRGVRIREKHTDPNGAITTIEEDYPVYVAWPELLVLTGERISAKRRDAGQRKDEEAWKDYKILVLEDLVRKFVYRGPVNELEKLPPDEALARKMPTVWISIPEPNQVSVSASVYDNAGHESEYVEAFISPESYRLLKQKVKQD